MIPFLLPFLPLSFLPSVSSMCVSLSICLCPWGLFCFVSTSLFLRQMSQQLRFGGWGLRPLPPAALLLRALFLCLLLHGYKQEKRTSLQSQWQRKGEEQRWWWLALSKGEERDRGKDWDGPQAWNPEVFSTAGIHWKHIWPNTVVDSGQAPTGCHLEGLSLSLFAV